MTPETALLAASTLHLGFQAVVTLVVYPALVELAPDAWERGHAAHSGRISVVVAPTYLAVALACVWALVAVPLTWPLLLAVGGNALAAAATALVAVPAHGRLGREGPRPALLQRLVRADRVRLLGAVLAVTGAVLASGARAT